MKYINATKIIYTQGEVTNAENLLKEQILQIGLSEPNTCIMKGRASVILDFGKEVSGGARMLTYAVQNQKTVRLRFGESVGETCAELKQGENGYGATNDHSLRDFCVELQRYSDMTFGQTGFRFLRIDTLSDDTVVFLKTVVAAVDTDTRAEIGSFECDDALVNDIWTTAAYTLRLCLQNGMLWDGIKRDRLVWIGDLYPEVRAANCLFGDIPETLRCLDFSMVQAPLPNPINGMPTYSLWWIINLREAYHANGDKASVAPYLPYAKGILEQIVSPAVAEDGTVSYSFNYIDWPSCIQEGEDRTEQRQSERLAGVAYLTTVALRALKELLVAFDEDTSLCDEVLAKIAQKKYTIDIYKQIAALGAWAGETDECLKTTLMRGGANGLSTFQSYPILTAVAGFGEYEAALSMMKEYYGGMLSVGATTFWEDFDLEWLENCTRLDEMPVEGKKDIHGDYGKFCYQSFRHSFCHAWSAGVIPYLVETVAGIKTEGAGVQKITITPHLSGLKHVKVKFPTLHGVVTVEHTLQENGTVNTIVDAPKGIEVQY
ncbi:MAG: hypothetical protein E7371_02580 [Clostridiales bacterium]|nr:hypothetical protein [Clostridiales bacterium]